MIKLSDAVAESTRFVAVGTAAGTVVMVAAFGILHLCTDAVPFGAGVVVSAVLGWAVAAGNFLLMAIAAEKAASDDNYDNAKRRMTVSYRYRTLMQLAFIVIAILVPFLNWPAAVIPLLLPSFVIKGKGILDSRKPTTRTSSDPEGWDRWDEQEDDAGDTVLPEPADPAPAAEQELQEEPAEESTAEP